MGNQGVQLSPMQRPDVCVGGMVNNVSILISRGESPSGHRHIRASLRHATRAQSLSGPEEGGEKEGPGAESPSGCSSEM